jgi:phosphate-selective porin OprO/OprP
MKKQFVTKTGLIIFVTCCSLLSTSALSKKIKISGDLMLDHDIFDAGFLEEGDSSEKRSEIRRAGLSFKTELMDDWKAKIKLDFSGDNIELKDAYINYKGLNWADIIIGKQKEGFGLEKLSSARSAVMIERSLVTSALAPGRSLGINLSGGETQYNWQLGYFQPDDNESASAITGRFAWLPWRKENELLHIGFAFSERDLDDNEFRVNEQMEVHTSDSLIEGTKILANKQSLQGIELLWQQAGFTALAEWQQASVTDINKVEYEYNGGYLQMSYQLSGGNRAYKNGELGKVIHSGWELTSRYSYFELVEEGHEVETYAIGVNYIVNDRLKFMVDYIKAEQFDDNNKLSADNAISLRAQYTF